VCGDEWGLSIVDLRDPTRPEVVGGLDTPAYCVGAEIVGRRLFLADQSGGLLVAPAQCVPKLVVEPGPAAPPRPDRGGLAAFPNPMRETTRWVVSTPEGTDAHLRIVDAGGRLVRDLLLEHRGGLPHAEVRWDRRDQQGRRIAGGVYFAELRGPSGVVRRERLVVLR
jgi:hypothetical protein